MENREDRISPMDKTGKPQSSVPDEGLHKLKSVLLTVLILCGGNGVGLIAGVLAWRRTGSIPLAIVLLVGITAAAFCAAMFLFRKRVRVSRGGRG